MAIATVSAIQSMISQSRCRTGIFCTTSIKAPRKESRSPTWNRLAFGKAIAPRNESARNAAMCWTLSSGFPGIAGGWGSQAITSVKTRATKNAVRSNQVDLIIAVYQPKNRCVSALDDGVVTHASASGARSTSWKNRRRQQRRELIGHPTFGLQSNSLICSVRAVFCFSNLCMPSVSSNNASASS